MKKTQFTKLTLATALLLSLTACSSGGGSGGSADTPATSPATTSPATTSPATTSPTTTTTETQAENTDQSWRDRYFDFGYVKEDKQLKVGGHGASSIVAKGDGTYSSLDSHLGFAHFAFTSEWSPFKLKDNKDIKLSFTDTENTLHSSGGWVQTYGLAEKGKPMIGVHQGEIKNHNLSGEIMTSVGTSNWNREFQPLNNHPISYIYVNQPYSSYGAVYVNENDFVLFNTGIKEANSYTNTYANGSATYKGQVIGAEYGNTPKLDGDVTLNLNIAGDNATVSGKITGSSYSKAKDGTIILDDVSWLSTYSKGRARDTTGKLLGDYSTGFVGSNDVTAFQAMISDERNPLPDEALGRLDFEDYQAVFGATKQ